MNDNLKEVTRTTRTGNKVIEYFNDKGERVKLIHLTSNSYSGKIAAIEDKSV